MDIHEKKCIKIITKKGVYLCNLSIDSTRDIVYNEITIKQEQSQGRRKYRKGNQEYKVRTGNRIREIEKSRKVTRCLKPAVAKAPI